MKKNILFVEPSTYNKWEKCMSLFKHAEHVDDTAGTYRSKYGSYAGRVLDIDLFTPEQQEIFDKLIQDLMDGSTIYVIPGYDTIYRDLAVTLYAGGFAEQGQIMWFKQSVTKKRIMKYFEDKNIKIDEVYE